MDNSHEFSEASRKTSETLLTIAKSKELRDLSRLSLPEIEAVVDQVARAIPAGNVPGMILSGLARLSGRRLPLETVKRDIDLLFKGVEQVLDQAVYTAFFAGPASIIWGYQNLLRLMGKHPEDAFPEGTWQFYIDYAMREDTARHANETQGFDGLLSQHQIDLSHVDRMTAWVMTAIHTLHQFDDLLENEWRERVFTNVLRELTQDDTGAARYTDLYHEWELQRPYGREADSEPTETYPAYRRRKFDDFLEVAMQDIQPETRREWAERIDAAKQHRLTSYQKQLSIAAYLSPSMYGETRTPVSLSQAQVGVIYQGVYYLIPVCQPNIDIPPSVTEIRSQIAALLGHPAEQEPAQLQQMAKLRRVAITDLREKLNDDLLQELDRLRLVPILLNFDAQSPDLSLPQIRQAERGVGDHALTLFDTGQTMVFDQSHIFFDGAWGAALAEIMTNEALSWANYLKDLPSPEVGATRPYTLDLQFYPAELELIKQAPLVPHGVSAETKIIDIQAMLKLRKYFKQRNDLISLTVNDLLVLYRAIHQVNYTPSPQLMMAVDALGSQSNPAVKAAAEAAFAALQNNAQINPTVVIPVDASQRSPRERLYPMTFEVPLQDLGLLEMHRQVMTSRQAYMQAKEDHEALFEVFNQHQRDYLVVLAAFGELSTRSKRAAITGESSSVRSIKLLAHIPTGLQRMLDQIPEQFDLLNDLIKGREVFSNVGQVAPTSTLTRFITAKDDNTKKTLAWGVMTDATGVMHITLRDFRPHVEQLIQCGQEELAVKMTQDYLQAYAEGLNTFIADLRRMTQTSRDAHPKQPE